LLRIALVLTIHVRMVDIFASK